jgi:hypothetical protein
MNQRQFAEKLLKVKAEKRRNLIAENSGRCNSELAKLFQEISHEIWTNKPQKISVIVEILTEIVNLTKDKEIIAYLCFSSFVLHP